MRMTHDQMTAYANAEFGGPAIGAWPRNKGEKLRPHKGGGGGDGGAGEREAQRQERIRLATDEINRIFNNQTKAIGTRMVDKTRAVQDAEGNFLYNETYQQPETYEYWAEGNPANSRDILYNEQRSAVYDLNKNEVDRQAKEFERTNRFGLARTGLLGGSADVDSTAEINRRTNEGLLRAGGIADQTAADLKTSDERTRANLISMAQSGIDTGTAATMALEGLSANAAQAAAQRSGSTVGQLFNDLSQAYLVNQTVAGRNSANPYALNQWYGVSDPRTGSSGKVQN